jgi:hypothetical protein
MVGPSIHLAQSWRKLPGDIANVASAGCIPNRYGVAIMRIVRLRYKLDRLTRRKRWTLQGSLAVTCAGHIEYKSTRHKLRKLLVRNRTVGARVAGEETAHKLVVAALHWIESGWHKVQLRPCLGSRAVDLPNSLSRKLIASLLLNAHLSTCLRTPWLPKRHHSIG